MTGGIRKGAQININLARAAEKHQIPLGLGSCRAVIDHPELESLFTIRHYAPTTLILANVGLVQLNYGFDLPQLEKILTLTQADALVFHLNPLQELLQPEGDHNFTRLLPKLQKVIPRLPVPVIVKEVGFGLSARIIEQLYTAGVRIFDTAGWGGTNWAFIESRRRFGSRVLGQLFSRWGISTTDSILAARQIKFQKKAKDIVVLGSGGVRSGLDIAKCLALGADLAGLALPFLQAALVSKQAVEDLILSLAHQLKIVMFCAGAKNLTQLRTRPLHCH